MTEPGDNRALIAAMAAGNHAPLRVLLERHAPWLAVALLLGRLVSVA